MKQEVVNKKDETTSISEDKEEKATKKYDIDSDIDEDIKFNKSRLKAGPTQTPEENVDDRKSDSNKSKLPESKSYDVAPYISRDDFELQDGDFIRYIKEDNIVYQGTILRGEPIENGFNYYHGQEDDYVVKLDFEDGKHVAMQEVQQEDSINIMIAKNRTSFGRNVETVSPNEIIAVSPAYEYDWYKFEDSWDIENDIYDVELES